MASGEPEHRRLMLAAVEREGEAHRAALAGDRPLAAAEYRQAAAAYRASWEAAPAEAYGRLIGMLKAAILAGDVAAEAAYARGEVGDDAARASGAAAYVRAIAALAAGDDDEAGTWAGAMRAHGGAFERTGEALLALARGDRPAYAGALEAILADFAARPDHLTGVRIADTAAMLEVLAEPRGLAVRPASPLLP